MRAVLRYRHIPFKWVPQGSQWDDLPPFPLIPAIQFPSTDGQAGDTMIDSSPLIARLEREYEERSVVPVDPVVSFIDFLFEDFADEWVTKMMYHYRWYYDDAIDKAKKLLPLDGSQQLAENNWQKAQTYISERQIGRRALVGSTETNRPAIEESYVRVLEIMQRHIEMHPFLLGERPGRGDFALYGQMIELLRWDPESARIGVARAPRMVNWVERMDDLSWWDVDADNGWVARDAISQTALELLPEIGRTYAPFLLANEAAMANGDETFTCVIDGHEYSQGTFVYQRKCLQWLQDEYRKLSTQDKRDVDVLLDGTGCEVLFQT